MATVGIGEKGTLPARVTAVGEAGHASMPNVGDNAVPLLGRAAAPGRPRDARPGFVALGGGRRWPRWASTTSTAATALHPTLGALIPAMTGTTMAPTLLDGLDASGT